VPEAQRRDHRSVGVFNRPQAAAFAAILPEQLCRKKGTIVNFEAGEQTLMAFPLPPGQSQALSEI